MVKMNLGYQTFPPLYKVPTYSEIIALTNQNEALFNTQIAYADQALETYLRQCIVNGAYDEQQIANLIDTIKNVYMVFVRQSAFLHMQKVFVFKMKQNIKHIKRSLQPFKQQCSKRHSRRAMRGMQLCKELTSAANALSVSRRFGGSYCDKSGSNGSNRSADFCFIGYSCSRTIWHMSNQVINNQYAI